MRCFWGQVVIFIVVIELMRLTVLSPLKVKLRYSVSIISRYWCFISVISASDRTLKSFELHIKSRPYYGI